MRPRYLVCITLLAACHVQVGAQAPEVLTNMAPAGATPAAQRETGGAPSSGLPVVAALPGDLPNDPGQELVPLAVPEPAPETGTPVEWEAKNQEWAGDTLTLRATVLTGTVQVSVNC